MADKYYVGKFYLDNDGVYRWKSNDRVPPEEILIEMFTDGVMDEEELRYCKMVRKRETDAFLSSYRKSMENYTPSAEEMFEMRAAFGEGSTVVNAITGKVTKL